MRRERAIELTKLLSRLYFVKRDYATLEKCLSKDITWIGTGRGEICRSFKEAQEHFQEEKEIYTGSFLLSNEEYQVQFPAEHVVCVLAEMDVRTPHQAELVFDEHMRFSVIYRKEGRRWKIIHLHNSMPDKAQEGAAYLNERRGRRDYRFIKEAAAEMAATRIDEVRKMDSLTGIFNMEGFVEHAEVILKEHPDRPYAILKFGINQFRYINHILGYRTGDHILREIASNLEKLCEEGEICSRIEKDNFAILMAYEDREALDRRINSFKEKFVSQETEETLNISIHFSGGVCLIEPGNKESVKRMLDKAMLAQHYRSTRRRLEDDYIYYDPEIERCQLREQELVETARFAMKRDDFKMYFQPQVCLDTGKVIGTEVLVRWVKPDGRIVMPDEFIPVFETTGFIKTLDFYMLEKLCASMRRWLDSGYHVPPVSINQSRLHLEDRKYVEEFCGVVDRWRIPHDLIAFELTESAFTEYNEMIQRLAAELHNRRFRLDIDDFGTGYTALGLLMLIEPDVLKMDRSLTANFENPKGQLVLKKLIEIAKETHTAIICEGIETREQVEYFRALHCDIAQGYYYYRPMPETAFEEQVLRAEDIVWRNVGECSKES